MRRDWCATIDLPEAEEALGDILRTGYPAPLLDPFTVAGPRSYGVWYWLVRSTKTEWSTVRRCCSQISQAKPPSALNAQIPTYPPTHLEDLLHIYSLGDETRVLIPSFPPHASRHHALLLLLLLLLPVAQEHFLSHWI